MTTIEIDEVLASRAQTCYLVLHEAGIHAEKFDSTPEGILVLLFSLVFVAQQYDIKPSELNASIRSVRTMIERAQTFCGKEAGISECVVECGLN